MNFFTKFRSMLFRSSGCFFCKMHYSEHLTLFITISLFYIRYTRKTLFRTSCKIIPISLYSITISWTRLFTNSGHEKKLIPNIRSHIRMFGRGETKANSPGLTPQVVFAEGWKQTSIDHLHYGIKDVMQLLE